MLKELDDMPHFMNMHPMTTMLTEDTLSISDNVQIGDQAVVNLNTWLHG